MKQIILKKLSLSNWRSLNLSVEFNSHKTSISGKNELGKSSLFHAWCWLLSGYTDSVNVKNYNLFDENNPITPNTPVASVKAVISIADIEYKLERRAKATFRRVKGSDVYEKASSDTYSLLIDDIETSVSNWNDFISTNICDNKMITYLLSGDFLANLAIEDRDKARQVMLSIVGEIKDSDYKGDYSCIEPQLAKGYTLNQIEEQASNMKKELDKEIIKLEAEIKNKQQTLSEYSTFDYATIQSEIDSKKNTITDIDNAILGKAESIKPILGQRDAIFEIINSKTLKLNECRNVYLNKQKDGRNEIKRKINDVEKNNATIKKRNEQKQRDYDYNIHILEQTKREYKNCELLREHLIEQRDEVKGRVFVNENCAYCGQELPYDKQVELQAKFNERKKKDLEFIMSQGKLNTQKMEHCQQRTQELQTIVDNGVKLEDFESADVLNEQLKMHEVNCQPFESTKEYAVLTKEIEDLKASLPKIPQNDNETLTDMKGVLMAEIDSLNQQMGLKSQCAKLSNEIKELEDKHKKLGCELALCERTIITVKEYREEQANIVSKRINSKLATAKVDMFRTQKDGKVVPDCIIRGKRGVQYATINNSAKTLINIELQQMMMKHFGVHLPIWIDECLNFDSEHRPQLDEQHIMLFASDSAFLNIE